MFLIHDLKTIFIHVQRTGGTSILNLLHHHSKDIEKIEAQHGNVKSLGLAPLLHYPTYYKFSFVRNPWERIFSWYALLTKNKDLTKESRRHDFEHFLKTTLFKISNNPTSYHFNLNQLDYFSDENDNLLIDYIGRFENFETDVKHLFQQFGIEVTDIPKINATPSKSYRDYYTPTTQAFVAALCQKDIAYFGYVF